MRTKARDIGPRGELKEAAMRRLLLLGGLGVVMSFAPLGATVFAAEIVPGAISDLASPIVSDSESAPISELHWVGNSFEEDVVILLRDITLLGIGTLILGVAGVCINARRVPGAGESPSHGDRALV